ncbi:hypothetical protein AKO1_014105 [Acrasis kona]|uniref:RGS domain-containing protein n=1 Tax=Acrasis kona TaxID=1008807 RepID=A0AAW2YZL5_9EUKA
MENTDTTSDEPRSAPSISTFTFSRKPGSARGTPSDELLSPYEFTFECIYDNEETRLLFQKYLKKIHNEAPNNFLIEIEKFSNLMSPKTRHVAATKIMTTYIRDGAKEQINLGFAVRQKIIKSYNETTDQECSKNLFDELRIFVYVELKQDCFQGFITHNIFTKFVKKKVKNDPEFLKSISTVKKRIDIETPSESEDVIFDTNSQLGVLYDPEMMEVTDEDFLRVNRDIADREMWKAVFRSEERAVFVSKNPFYNGKRGLKKMYETGIIPFSAKEAFNAYTDAQHILLIEKEIAKITTVDYQEQDRHALVVLRFQYKLPFPLSNRDFCLLHSAKRDSNGTYSMIRKSILHPDCPVDKNYVRAVATGGIVFEKIDENTCRYSQTYYADYGGWLTASMFNKIVEMRDDSWHHAMIKACRARRVRGLGRPAASNSIINTLEYYEKVKQMPPDKM